MDGHTKLVVGGVATVAASVAVIVAVAVSTAGALIDVPGAPVTQAAVVVPSHSARPTPVPMPVNTAHAATAETVPAIAPAVIPPPEPVAPRAETPVTPPVAEAEAEPEQELAESWRASGDWGAAREWATDHGWSAERQDAWIAELEAGFNDRNGHDDREGHRDRNGQDDRHSPQTPATAGDTSDDDHSWSYRGSKKEQSPTSPHWRD